MHRILGIGAISIGLLPLRAMAQAAPTPPADLDNARRAVFMEAVKAFEAKDWATCEVKADGVWSQKQAPQTAALLGLCEAELGKYAEAAEHLDFYRSNDPKNNPGRTQEVDAAWQKIQPKVAIATISCQEPDVDLMVEGKPRGKAPLTLYVTVDTSVEAKKLGFKPKTVNVTAKLGSSQVISLALEVDKENPPPPPPGERPIWPAILLGGVAAAGFGVGIGLTVVSVQKKDEAADLAATCVPRSSCETEGDALLDDVEVFRGVGIGGFILAAGATAGLVGYLLAPGQSNTSAASVSVFPVVGPSEFGLRAVGSF